MFLRVLYFIGIISIPGLASTVVTPLYPVNDGESGLNLYDESSREIKVIGSTSPDSRVVGWLTFQLQDIDVQKVTRATLALRLGSVTVEGRLRLFVLTGASVPAFGPLSILIDGKKPFTTVPIVKDSAGVILYIDVTRALSTKEFLGFVFGGNAALEAWFGSKETSTGPVILLGYDNIGSVRGAPGDTGPLPEHQWRNTAVGFQNDTGWGRFIDVKGVAGPQGPQGDSGLQGPSGTQQWTEGNGITTTTARVGIKTGPLRTYLDVKGTLLARGAQLDASHAPRGMRLVPAGTVGGGTVTGGTITLARPFWLDATEVTQADYAALMKSNPSTFKGGNRPVHNVTWYDALLYCNERSKRDGFDSAYGYSGRTMNNINCVDMTGLTYSIALDTTKGYQLPYPVLFEYAYRAGTTADYYWSCADPAYPLTQKDTIEVHSYAVWRWNSWELGSANPGYGPNPVASKFANNFGLFDMAGNVEEWMISTPAGYPAYRHAKGGGWWSHAPAIKAIRIDGWVANFISPLMGFRCALAVRQ